jgi:hypothetical protein
MTIALRPLNLAELLDRCFFLYRKHFLVFVGIAVLPQLILLSFQLVGVVLRTQTLLLGVFPGLLWTLATGLISLGIYAAAQGATVVAVSQLHLGRSISIGEAFAGVKGRIFSLALIMIGTWVGVGVGFMLLIVPGIILVLMWALTIPVAVIEDKGLRDSVSRSAELTKGHRGRVFVILLLFLVLTYAAILLWEIPILAVIGITARAHRGAVGVPLWTQVAIPLGTFFSQSLVGPLMTIAISLMYYDERVRKEAFDLQHMMTSLDAAQSGAVPVAGA